MATLLKAPSTNDFGEALQHPKVCFKRPDLKTADIEKNGFGLPLPISGGFALTYKAKINGGDYAIRCFHKLVPDRHIRYKHITETLKNLDQTFFVPIDYLEEQILIKGTWHPITLMKWIQGKTLNQYVHANYQNSDLIQDLALNLRTLCNYLGEKGIAHGDLSHLNLVVSNGQLKLIDYDGMYVPALRGFESAELGNQNFQHPERKKTHFGPNIDRFSATVLYLALMAISIKPELYAKSKLAGDGILFSKQDFVFPEKSQLLADLQSIRELRDQANLFIKICQSSFDSVPSLNEFINNKVSLQPSHQSQNQKTLPPSAFSALAVAKLIEKEGETITVVGKVEAVRDSLTKFGRPYIFVNFGHWFEGCFTMVFWSQGVAQLEENNIDAHKFENEYVSVTGLVTIYSRDEIASPQMVIRSVADFRFIDKATHDQALKPVIGSNLPTPQKHISTTTPVPIKPTSNFGAVDQMRA